MKVDSRRWRDRVGAGVCACVCVGDGAAFTLSVHRGQQSCEEGSRGQAQPELHVWPLKAQQQINRSERHKRDVSVFV